MRLILHAGTHKTGTTTIQTVLRENRGWLLERGFQYPHLTDKKNHNKFAHRIATDGYNHADASYNKLMRETAATNVTILSAEEFSARIHSPDRNHWQGFLEADYWERKQHFLGELRHAFRDFDDITFYICFRRHDEYAAALYTTNLISRRINWSFPEFLHHCAPIFDYRRQLESFRATFDDVQILNFDDLRKDLVKRFFAWVGVPLPPKTDFHSRITPDPRLTYWFYVRSIHDEQRALVEQRRNFLLSGEATACLPEIGGASFWQSSAQRIAFLSKCSDPTPGFFAKKENEIDPTGDVLDHVTMENLDSLFLSWQKTKRYWLLRKISKMFRPDGLIQE